MRCGKNVKRRFYDTIYWLYCEKFGCYWEKLGFIIFAKILDVNTSSRWLDR